MFKLHKTQMSVKNSSFNLILITSRRTYHYDEILASRK